MIEVIIKNDGRQMAHIRIKKVKAMQRTPEEKPGEFADYKINYQVDRGTGAGMHVRMIYGFPRKYFNVLALVLQSLNALNEKDLKLERDFDPDETSVPADVARGLRRAVRQIQGK